MDRSAALAATRFGFGPRLGWQPPRDPIAWLEADLAAADEPPRPDGFDTPPGTAEGLEALMADRAARQRSEDAQNGSRLFRAEAAAWLGQCLTAEAGFREQLVAFWANHFTVSRRVGPVGPLAGIYVREAIRPHVTGRFVDMLLAVARHPAMLFYLNNNASIGPNSPIGQRTGRGLNENLAREIMELHTLSPAAGYSQADVTSFARILTGWSVAEQRPPFGFQFRKAAHEPGEKTLLGRSFPEQEAGGTAALEFLGTHPATFRFLAQKLVRHFVADAPPAGVVDRVAGVLGQTGGNLGAAARALLREQPAWEPALSKLRSPLEYTLAVWRALGAGPDVAMDALGGMNALGQPLWSAPGPNGWPDRAEDWVAPEAMVRRTELAWRAAGRAAGKGVAPAAVLDTVLGPLARPETRTAALGAGSAREALVLLLASPEFQRR